ncbi:MAG: metallophosphoesterase [Clostridiales bacterium]|nr:metallophosphoesterase [Clostridiales bacterium]MCD8225161.1 metallophosphoesterase [Clostridiales bacterium]
MKILVVSDTHRRDDNLHQVIDAWKPLDMLIHLGDVEGSEHIIGQWVNEGCKLAIVRGNNDFFSSLEMEIEMSLGPHRMFLTHGHYYNVSLGVEALHREAEARGCDIVMYGHTHRPYLETIRGVTILNPGSLSYPRQEGRKPSYLMMEMDEKTGAVKYRHYFLG